MKILYQFLEMLIACFGFFLAKIPHRLFYSIVCIFAFIARILDRRRATDAMSNLNFIYEKTYSIKQKKIIIKQCYKNFIFVLLESIRLPYINQEAYFKRFDFRGEDKLFDLLRQNKSVVFISAHYGYWESLGTAVPMAIAKNVENHKNYELFSLGRLTNSIFINSMIIKRREIVGVKLIDKKGAFKKLVKIYRSKVAGTGILVDQNISQTEGIEVDFFGKRATHTTIASILSRRFNIDIIPVLIDFNADYSRYIVHILEPFKTPNTHDINADILNCTQRQAKIMETMIRKNPSSWFWFHKRWKSFYREIYEH